jgi:hypothetical protein
MSEAIESPEPGHALASQKRPKAEVSSLTIITTLVMLLVFAGLVWIVFLQKQAIPTTTDQEKEERLKNLAQLNADNQKILTTYHWVDKSKGIVGIPINRAMDLVLKDLAANHPHAAGPVNPPAASPTPVVSPAPAAANQEATPAPSANVTSAPSPAASPSSSPEPTASPEPSATPSPATSPSGQ